MVEGKIEAPERIWLTEPYYHPTRDKLRIVHEEPPPVGPIEYARVHRCRACDKGLRLAPDGIHYDDERGGQTWGVCDKVVESANTRQRAGRAARKIFTEILGSEHLRWESAITDIIAAEFEK